jgi:hypothetical protein
LFSAKILQRNRVEVEKNSVTIQRNRFLAKAELRFYTTECSLQSVAAANTDQNKFTNFLLKTELQLPNYFLWKERQQAQHQQ